MPTTSSSILALDVGEKRIGAAIASTITRLPQSLPTIAHAPDVMQVISKLIKQYDVTKIVIGLPRNLHGERTDQTKLVENFAHELQGVTGIEVYFQDEALTSKQAEQELKQHKVTYTKEAVDALAALYILEDFLKTHREEEYG